MEITLKSASIPKNIKDPDQLIKQDGIEKFKKVISEAKIINPDISKYEQLINLQSNSMGLNYKNNLTVPKLEVNQNKVLLDKDMEF